MTIRVICDVHIARRIVRFFEVKGCPALHVNDILDGWHTKDAAISDYADRNGLTVVTKDADFKHSHLLYHSPSRLLKIDLGNISTDLLLELLELHFAHILEAFQAPVCLVELGLNYLRISLPDAE